MKEFPTFTDDLKSELKWLEDNKDLKEKIPGIKQQKFLLFYNLFLKATGDNGNFTGLCAWGNGPVYAQVHAAIKHHYTVDEIINTIENPISIDETLARVAKFVVELLSEEEVSELTHEFDFWKVVDNQYENNQISFDNLTQEDEQKIRKILNAYDIEFIKTHKIYKTELATFLININDYEFIMKNMIDKLQQIKNDKPIKIRLDYNGITQEEINKKELI